MEVERKLVQAAERGDVRELIFLIQQQGAKVDALWNGHAPLVMAARSNQADCVSTLLELGADVDVIGESRISALDHVTRLGHASCMLPLLRASVLNDFLRRCPNGMEQWQTQLLHEIRNKSFCTVDTMLTDFSRQHAPDEDYLNLIMFLLLTHSCPALSLNLILELGARINVNYRYGLTPLIVTAAAGMVEQINVLLERGANENVCDDLCYLTPLHYAAKTGDLKSLELLLKNGSRTSDRDYEGRNALMHAAECGSEECIILLLRKGYRVSSLSHFGMTALMYSVCSGNVLSIERLLLEGSHLSEKDREGKSSLIYAAEKGKLECLVFLISKGCNVDDQDTWKKSALMYAVEHGQLACASLLLRSGAAIHLADGSRKCALHFAADAGSVDCLELLLDYECDVNVTDSMGTTALMLASLCGSEECVELILNRGGIANGPDPMFGRTAIMYAARKGSPECMRLLLNAGASRSEIDMYGRNALMYAAEAGSTECIDIIIEADTGVNKVSEVNRFLLPTDHHCLKEANKFPSTKRFHINRFDFEGKNALMLAIRQGRTNAVRRLLEAGADHTVVNLSNENALSIAIHSGKIDCLEIILDADSAIKSWSSEEGSHCLRLALRRASRRTLDTLVHRGIFQWNWFDNAHMPFVKLVYPLLINAGIPPGEFKMNGSVVTLLRFSLLNRHFNMALDLLNFAYLSKKDIVSKPQDTNFQSAHSIFQSVQGQAMATYQMISWPLTLQTLSLVTISRAIKPHNQSSHRSHLIHTLPLPPALKRKLQYRPISYIHEIEMQEKDNCYFPYSSYWSL